MIDLINEYIGNILQYINNVSNGNQFVAGSIVIWTLGLSSYLVKVLPKHIINFLSKHVMTEMSIHSCDKSFYDFINILNKSSYSNKFRRIKIYNGRYGDDNKTKSIGYGNHIIWYKFRPLFVNLSVEKSDSFRNKELITIRKIGRSHKFFNSIINDMDQKRDDNFYNVNISSKDIYFCNKQPVRDFESIFLEDSKIKYLLNRINNFVNNEQWYKDHGIPYQLGILFYGPPGTGKTSLIKAVASYMKRDLTVIPSGRLDNLFNSISNMGKGSILVLEDIDSNTYIHKRENEEDNKNNFESSFLDSIGNISSVLNAIDGVVQNHGRVIIATTNHIEKIDEAVLRPGRIDIKINVDYINQETFNKFLKRFFGKTTNLELYQSNLTGAMLQEDILNDLTYDDIINKYCVKPLTGRINNIQCQHAVGSNGKS